MGRITWESIPDKFKPLNDRINIVVSQTMSRYVLFKYLLTSDSSGFDVVPDFDSALKLLDSSTYADVVDNIFIIGGAKLYKVGILHYLLN